jgi:hypothetical protein
MENVLEWTRAVLACTPARWENLTQTLPASLLTRRPAAGEWCALECLQHLIDSDAVYRARLGFFRAGQDFPDFDPDRQGTRLGDAAEPAQLAARFKSMRAGSLAALAEITPADLALRAQHSLLGPVSLSDMVHAWSVHDLLHTAQAERALLQPFLLGAGAWQTLYREHLMMEPT